MPKEKLKLGILLNSFEIHAWLYKSIERIVISDHAEISVVILNDGECGSKSGRHKLWQYKNSLGYHLFRKIDEYLFRQKPDAFEIKTSKKLLSNSPLIRVKTLQNTESFNYFKHEYIDKIREYNLDVLVNTDFKNLDGDILSSARYGVWSYYHGDDRIKREGLCGFRESIKSWPVTWSMLKMLSGNPDKERVLYISCSTTYPFSPSINKNRCFWASSLFLPRQIERLYHLGESGFLKEIEKFKREFRVYSEFYSGKSYKTPSNLTSFYLLIKYLSRIMTTAVKKTFYLDQWFLFFDLSGDTSVPLHKFRKMDPPKDRFWADPHVVKADDRYYIFIEELINKTKKGHISVIEMDSQGNYEKPVKTLEKDYHLSYPFVFNWEKRYYMIPESSENRTIELYECLEFPYKWKFKMNLMENIRAVDTTLLYHHKTWWLFVNIAEEEYPSVDDELFLFYSDQIFTNEWHPHPMNPIISDAKRARPAGKIFLRNGNLYRPSQNCSFRYGYGININKIIILSKTEYIEKKVSSLMPNWNKKVKGVHTFSKEGKLTFVDAVKPRRKFL